MTHRNGFIAIICRAGLQFVLAPATAADAHILAPVGRLESKKPGSACSSIVKLADGAQLTVADDGAMWTAPRIIAREPKKWISYSDVFEAELGLLWLFNGQGKFAAFFRDADLLSA